MAPKTQQEGRRPLFAVVVEKEVGTVYEDKLGSMTTYQAAFQLIGDQGCDGTYRFPAFDKMDAQPHHIVTVNVHTAPELPHPDRAM